MRSTMWEDIFQRLRQTVQLPDDECITLAEMIEEAVQLRAV
jgi:hypothetical protein